MSNRDFFNKMLDNFEDYQKDKINEKITHEEFMETLPEQIKEINASFESVINFIDAINVSKDDLDLKKTIKNRVRKLYRRVQKLMDLHMQEEESEEQSNFNQDDAESITEISSGAGGGTQGSLQSNKSNVNSVGRYGSKKINVKRFKQ